VEVEYRFFRVGVQFYPVWDDWELSIIVPQDRFYIFAQVLGRVLSPVLAEYSVFF